MPGSRQTPLSASASAPVQALLCALRLPVLIATIAPIVVIHNSFGNRTYCRCNIRWKAEGRGEGGEAARGVGGQGG